MLLEFPCRCLPNFKAHVLNDSPHPQLPLALGLVKVNSDLHHQVVQPQQFPLISTIRHEILAIPRPGQHEGLFIQASRGQTYCKEVEALQDDFHLHECTEDN